jgi:hypothetical protein
MSNKISYELPDWYKKQCGFSIMKPEEAVVHLELAVQIEEMDVRTKEAIQVLIDYYNDTIKG